MRGLCSCLLVVGLLAVGCSPAPGGGETQGQMSVWLTASSTEGNTYRLRNASFRVSVAMGSEVATVASDDVTEPPPESIDLSVDPGAYTVELLDGWQLYRVEPGDDVLVVAELASPQTLPVNVVSGVTSSVVYTFQTSGEIVQTGPGNIGIGIDVEETQCLGNSCDDGDLCTDDICNPATGECSYATALDNTPCVSGMEVGVCLAGSCVGLCEGVDCSSANQCVEDGQCDPNTGQCAPGSGVPINTTSGRTSESSLR